MENQSLRELHGRRKNRAAAPIGALVLFLAAAGLVALIWLGFNVTDQILDNSKEKEKFAKIVQPVLMFDPPPFEDVTTLDNKTLLESALWATMLGEKRETYTFDAQNNLVVPASDVDVSSTRLFGPAVKLEHGSFPSDFGISYDYNPTTKAYLVPVTSATALYTPRVDEISREGDVYSLLIGYIPPGTAWNTAIGDQHSEPDPHKYMVYKLKKADRYYQLTAIEDPPPEKQVQYRQTSPLNGEIASVEEKNVDSETRSEGGEEGGESESQNRENGEEDGGSSEDEESGDEQETPSDGSASLEE